MERDEKLHTFPYSMTVGGIEHHYRITEDEGKFWIEKNGIVIASVENKEGHWAQVSGEPLSKKRVESIGNRIEDWHN